MLHYAREEVSISGNHKQLVTLESNSNFTKGYDMKSYFPSIHSVRGINKDIATTYPYRYNENYYDAISRTLSDDTFHWTHGLKRIDSENSDVFFNTNNKHNIDSTFFRDVGLNKLKDYKYLVQYPSDDYYSYNVKQRHVRAHSSNLGNPKLSGSTIQFGEFAVDEGGSKSDAWEHINILYQNIATFNFIKPDTFLSGTYDDEYLYSTIETIEFLNPIEYENDVYKNKSNNGYWDKEIRGATINNNGVKFVPRKLDRFNQNEVLFDVYMSNDYGESKNLDSDHTLTTGKLSTSGVSGDMEVQFVRTPGEEQYGEIRIADNTYYDYDSKSTKKGLGTGSKRGELIPYDFSGEYDRTLKIKLNASMGEIQINLSEDIGSPLLDPYTGIYKLEVESDQEPVFEKSGSRYYINKSRLDNFIDKDIDFRLETFMVKDNE